MIKKLLDRIFNSKSAKSLAHASTTVNPTHKAQQRSKLTANHAHKPPDLPHHGALSIAHKTHKIDRNLLSNAALKTTEGLHKAGFEAYIVGGAVRD